MRSNRCAFSFDRGEAIMARLNQAGVSCLEGATGRTQIYIKDLGGNIVEFAEQPGA